MLADSIKKQNKTLEERGIPSHSYFHAHFHDGSDINETNTNWNDISELKRVQYQGGTKSVMISSHPLKRLEIHHGELSTFIDIPEGHDVYQAIRAESTFIPGKDKQTTITGRVIGLVKDGEVVEERFLNGQQNVIIGWKK